RLERRAPLTLERGEHEDADQREEERAAEREQMLGQRAVLVRAHRRPIDEERERDARGRQLRQRDAEADHPAQDEVHADKRADDRVAQQEVGLEHLEQRRHAICAPRPKSSSSRSGASIVSVLPLTTRPPSTHTTDSTSERTCRRWWLTSTTVRPRSRFSRATT